MNSKNNILIKKRDNTLKNICIGISKNSTIKKMLRQLKLFYEKF